MASWTNLLPLLLLLALLGGLAFVGYHIYLWSTELADRGSKSLEKRNLSFTKEGGLKVGVREVGEESYVDRTQNVLVNVWNTSAAALPNANSSNSKPALSRTSSQTSAAQTSASPRPSIARASSSQQRVGGSSSGASKLAAPVQRPQRSASPVPGGWE